MRLPPIDPVLVAGAAAAVVGLAGATVFFAQPWRSCEYDTSPAACAALPQDAAAVMVFLAVLALGAAATVIGIVRQAPRADARR